MLIRILSLLYLAHLTLSLSCIQPGCCKHLPKQRYDDEKTSDESPPCKKCKNDITDPKECSSGQLTTEICNCCNVCAKDAGEECGGSWNTKGKCADHLFCKREGPQPGVTPRHDAVGKCKKKEKEKYGKKEKYGQKKKYG